MTKAILHSLLLLLVVGCNQPHQNKGINPSSDRMIAEPKTVAEVYFDTTVIDPFRQLENLKDSSVLNWFEEQGRYANSVLTKITGREQLIELMNEYDHRKLYHVDKIKVTKNDRYFYLKRKSEEETFQLYYRKGLKAKEQMLFNPEDLKIDGNSTFAIYDYSPDWNGDKIAIAVASKGSDKMQIVIYDVATKSLLPQIIRNNFNASNQVASWLPNNKGFLYLGYDQDTTENTNVLLNTKTLYYQLGEDVSKAIDIFSKASCPDLEINPEDFPDVSLDDENSKYLLAQVAGPNNFTDGYYLRIEDLYKGQLNWKPLYKSEHQILGGTFVGDDFVFISTKDASNRKIAKTNINHPEFNSPEVLIPERNDEVIQDFVVSNSGLYYTTTRNGVEAKLYSYHNKRDETIPLPGKYGRIFIANKSNTAPDLWVTVTGWINSKQRMKYDIATHRFTREQLAPDAAFPEFENFEVEELTVKSHDGELVPLSVISKKGTKHDGSNPTLLYGYGAYGIPWRPYFMPDWLTWVENGGILCFSHIRGGGEKGSLWHMQGKNHNKPNSWKDFIACAEFLIENKYTSSKKLVIYGGSAGGIVIGRSMTERPDLYAAVISEVGMLNAIRFANMPGGLNHAKEFGYVSDSTDCKDLLEMDAYLHINDQVEYPPFLAVVGMNDLRVSPWQSGKFVARLQQNHWKDNTCLMMVDRNEGHYFNSTKTKSMEKLASIFAFAFWQTGHRGYEYKE